MITAISLLVFLAFYLFYINSKRMPSIGVFGFEKWTGKQPHLFKILGSLLLIVSAALYTSLLGIGSGTFVFFIALMMMGSLVILLVPLKVVNLKSSCLVFSIFLIYELLFF
ncbi:hypothetical protein [Flagellimonas onchidii]|uniref:hypothetical protein n=1 Tax=Flagellimonas onchidii TaxID=2562684 RepID=UPI0010A5CB91|nr:hypothetical protein [Allomuricauda onchidii]